MKFLQLPELNHGSASQRLFSNWIQDIALLLGFALLLLLHRFLMIGLFHSQMSEKTDFPQYLYALWMGLHYDFSTASKWVIFSFFGAFFVISQRWHFVPTRLRQAQILVFATLALFLLVSDITFFINYNDHYNQMVFGLIYDDFNAIVTTIWKEYHPLLSLFAIFLLSLAVVYLSQRWLQIANRLTRNWDISSWRRSAKVALFPALFLFFIFLSRGLEIAGSPISLKSAFVTRDMLLNHLVPNPLFSLWDTVKWRLKMNGQSAFKQLWPPGDVESAISAAFPTRAIREKEPLEQALLQNAMGAATPPQHIVLLIMESHSGWTVFPEYQSMGFSPGLSQLAAKGAYWKNFLPASTGTIGAINTIVSGLPDSGLFTNYEAASNHAFETSIAVIFKRLGYKTRFFYGGLMGWQRLDQFTPAQGFEEVYGGGDMGAGKSFNEWGINDQFLFEFIAKTIHDNANVKSLNVVMSTSNHPPYDIDLVAEGYPVHQLPDALTSSFADTLKVLGHLWYADKYLKRFVDDLHDQDVLFAVTGDHTERLPIKFPGDSALESVAVPLVLYGSGVDKLPAHRRRAGSHIDIMPTLVDMSAPPGFAFHSYGSSLLRDDQHDVGVSLTHIVTPDDLINMAQPSQHFRIGENGSHVDDATILQQKAQKALSWYRIRHDKEIRSAMSH